MRIVEFQTDIVSMKDVVAYLRSRFTLSQVGGKSRVYHVGNELGVVFLINNSPRAVGLTWQQGSTAIAHIYLWNQFNIDHTPDIYSAIPMGATHEILKAVGDLVEHPQRGIVEDTPPKVTFHTSSGTQSSAQPINFLLAKVTPVNVRFSFTAGDRIDAKLEREFMEQNGENATMEQQYAELRDKVKLVASNQSTYIKSLLITGAPSSGKSFTVIETLKSLGYVEGQDYIVIKGSITDAALYQTLIEQIDSLTVFDDCDAVVETTEGINILKGALDTNAIRELSRATANSINTKQMTTEDRDDLIYAISRILRGVPEGDDLSRFSHYLSKKAKPASKSGKKSIDTHGMFDLPSVDELDDLDGESKAERLQTLQAYFSRHLPNRIDFRGRIIFISNMDESEWDTAITSRAFYQNMNFGSSEMLDFIDKIKGSIPAENITLEQKDEVLAYIRELHNAGKLRSKINFRFVQKCFDLRLCANWKKMVPFQ